MAEPLRVVLDCDPGHDDAVAMLLAARHARLLGVTTVAGNAPLSWTTANATIVRDLLGIDVPVHAGADRPLVVEPVHADYVHGESGMDGAHLPEPSGPPASADAVGFLVDTCRAEEGTWIVATGPLTNVALALRAAPDLVDRIAGISLMGGGSFGNRTPAAEFNIWCDPHAAAIVFRSGAPLVMTGLDVTHSFLATPERVERIRVVGSPFAQILADLFVFFSGTYTSRHEGLAGAPVHDPVAVLALTHPQLVTTERRHVDVEASGDITRGMTVIDRRALRDRPEPNCTLVTAIDAGAAFDVVIDAVAAIAT